MHDDEFTGIHWATILSSPLWSEWDRWMRHMRDQYRAAAEKNRSKPEIRDECLARSAWLSSWIDNPQRAYEEMQDVVTNYLQAGDEDSEQVMRELNANQGIGGLQRAWEYISSMTGGRVR